MLTNSVACAEVARRVSAGFASLVLLSIVSCANSPQLPESSRTGTAVRSMIDSSTSTTDAITTPPPVDKGKKKTMSDRMAKTFDDAVARGDASWREGAADMAIYFYVQALSFRSRDFETLCKIGAIEQKRDKPDLAARAFELAAQVKPGDARISGRLGLLYVDQGDEDKAAVWLSRSVDSGSDDWHVYDSLGVIEGHKAESVAALQHLQQARSLAPAEIPPLLHQGQVQFSAGEFQAAEASLRDATSKGPVPEAQDLLGQILAKRRAYPEAIDSLLRVRDPARAYNLVGQLAMANGDAAVALHYFEEAATSSPIYFAEAHREEALARERLETSR